MLALVIANFRLSDRLAQRLGDRAQLPVAGTRLRRPRRFWTGVRTEREQASLEAMKLMPASPAAIFAGKAIAAVMLLVICKAVLLPAITLFFGTPLTAQVVIAVLLATLGMIALGRLFAAVGRAFEPASCCCRCCRC